MTILFETDPARASAVRVVLGPMTQLADSALTVELLVRSAGHDLVVVGPDIDESVACSLAATLRLIESSVGVVVIRKQITSSVLREAMKAGVRDVVAGDDSRALVEACNRSREVSKELRLRQPATATVEKAGQIVTVFAAKGGCGKTTVATNLASAFARGGQRTCLVDLDLAFGDVAIAMQLQPNRTIADALGLSALDETAVRSLVTHHTSGVDAILAPVEPGTVESIINSLVGDLLDLLKSMYDVVVVDTPPAFTEHVLATFDRADHFVLLTTLDIPALKNLKLTLETLEMLGYPRERWHIVLNRSDAKVGLSTHDVEAALRTSISVEIPSSRSVPAAINRGVPIVTDQPTHPVSLAVRRLANSLVAPPLNSSAAPSRGIFSFRRKSGVS